MPVVVLKPKTHKRLARVKAEIGARSFDAVISKLLDYAEKELGIPSRGEE